MILTILVTALSWVALASPDGSKLEASRFSMSEAQSSAAAMTIRAALELTEWTTALRRELHTCPELLYDLDKTSDLVRRTLEELRIPFDSHIAQTGIVATIGTGRSPCVALRADMDALPIPEEVDSAFKSRHPGQMHACGHDAHTAMLLTAARILKERESELSGTIKILFQPAEEGGAGGLAMVKAGVLDALPKIERVFALHVWPGLPAGTVATRPGTIMAAAASITREW